jgi:hypothetical protein
MLQAAVAGFTMTGGEVVLSDEVRATFILNIDFCSKFIQRIQSGITENPVWQNW